MHVRPMTKMRPAEAQIGSVLTVMSQVLSIIMSLVAVITGIEGLVKGV